MTRLLIGRCLPPGSDPKDPAVRQRCGVLAGVVGLALNLLLCAGKLACAVVTGSVAAAADGLNNLSDAASAVVTLVGFRMAGSPADEGHPFGHGRMEYLAGLIVSLAILLMGLEVGRSALGRIFAPEPLEFSWPAAAVLACAVAAKLWLGRFNRLLGRAIGSAAMEATAADALSDALSTAVVLLSALAGRFFDLQTDGLAGLLVAAFILKTGWEAAKDTLDPLLGCPIDPELAREIEELALNRPEILGIHDLICHDYGPGRTMVTFHAEVPADASLLQVHDAVDRLERELREKYRLEAVIHIDPMVRDAGTDALRAKAEQLAWEIDPRLTIHDFRSSAGKARTRVSFDLMVPYHFPMSDEQVRHELAGRLRALSERIVPVIRVDHPYVDSRRDGE